MNNSTPQVITWSQAEAMARRETQRQQELRQDKLEEFLESDLGMMDAVDLFYYAELTGLKPNVLRRMHHNNSLRVKMNTYKNDTTDDVLNIY